MSELEVAKAAARDAIRALEAWLATVESAPDLPVILTTERGAYLTTEGADLLLME